MSANKCSECGWENPSKAKHCLRCKFPFDGSWPSLVGKAAGKYKLVRRVGGGGFGAVYEARHVALNNAFAVKVLDPALAEKEQFIERFQREALVMAELQHENLVQVVDFGMSDDIGFYLITEWLKGRSLFKIWRYHTKELEWGWLLALYSQVLDALQEVHEQGIVHQDLKPENLMVTRGSRTRMLVKIVDFGIAMMVAGRANGEGVQESIGKQKTVIGTPFYMAPELVRGEMDRVGPRTDLYACGIMLGELLTRQRVFDGGSHADTMRLHLEAIPPTLSELRPDLTFSDALEDVFAKSLAKDPEDRFQTASEFYGALESAMKAEGVEPIWDAIYQDVVTSKRPPEQPKRPAIEYQRVDGLEAPKGRSWLVPLLAGGLTLVLVLVMLFAVSEPKPKPRSVTKRKSNSGWIGQGKQVVPDIPAVELDSMNEDGGEAPKETEGSEPARSGDAPKPRSDASQ